MLILSGTTTTTSPSSSSKLWIFLQLRLVEVFHLYLSFPLYLLCTLLCPERKTFEAFTTNLSRPVYIFLSFYLFYFHLSILADFGNLFFRPVMATNIIENFTILLFSKFFDFSNGVKKNFFLRFFRGKEHFCKQKRCQL